MKPSNVFRTSAVGEILIIELAGVVSSLAELTISKELGEVRNKLRHGSFNAVILDLEHVAYFGSSMLEAIRSIWNDVHPTNGKLLLCNASDIVREILQLAKFDHLWPIIESREEAIRMLQS